MTAELGDGVKYLNAKPTNCKVDLIFSHRSLSQSCFCESIFDEIITGFIIVRLLKL